MSFLSSNTGRILPALCVLSYLLTPSVAQASENCESPNWIFQPSSNLYNSADEVALLDGGNVNTYGTERDDNNNILFRQCEIDQRGKVIKIPVFMVDWADYNPATDSSNPNNPNAQPIDGYQPRTVAEVSQFLNHSDTSVAKYFRDISGGRIQLEFVVFGWIRSSDEGAILKNRQQYITLNESDNRYYCDQGQVFKDAISDAYLKHGFLPQNFDVNANNRSHDELLLNGAVLLYEGGPGLCSGTNLSMVDGLGSFPAGVIADQAALFPFALSSLARDDAAQTSVFSALAANLRVYNNIPETDVAANGMYSWTHELGHLLLGFADYYYDKFNMGYYGLSAQPADTSLATHPSAVEKWLFAKWLTPTNAQQNATYSLTSHDIADGTDYVASNVYLHKHLINSAENHFLLIENRWFDKAGNTASVWAKSSDRDSEQLKSGLQITEVNLALDTLSSEPQLKRHTKSAQVINALTEAWQQGDSFYQCFSNNYCVRIDNISAANEQVSYRLSAGVDSDRDGMPDDYEMLQGLDPQNAADAALDKDEDGLTNLQEYQLGTLPNNADTDADGIPDGWEVQYGLSPLSASDASTDSDIDGLTNLQEFNAGTQPNNADTDGDSIPDGWEVQYGLSPLSASDASTDSDNDGLTNLQEFSAGTQPNNADTDGDSIPDGWEVQYGLNPLDANDATSDSDNDGVSALQEYQNGTNPKVSNKTNTETATSSSSGGGVSAWLLLLLGMTLFQRYRTNR